MASKEIRGLTVMMRIADLESVKKYLTGGKKSVKFDKDNSVHIFLLATLCRKYKTIDPEFYKECLKELGIMTKAKEKFDGVIERVVKRVSFGREDPMTLKGLRRRSHMRVLFLRKAKAKCKEAGQKVLKTKWLSKNKIRIVTQKKLVFIFTCNNGRVELQQQPK